jgi:hypothetical protein
LDLPVAVLNADLEIPDWSSIRGKLDQINRDIEARRIRQRPG